MKLSDVPLTEYSREEGLIAPDFEGLPLHLPRRCLMAFLGEKRIAAFAESRKGKVIGSFLSLTKSFPLYEIPGKEPLLLVQSPAGALPPSSSKKGSLPTAQKKCLPSAAAAPSPTFRKTASSPLRRPLGTKAPPSTTCLPPGSSKWTRRLFSI